MNKRLIIRLIVLLLLVGAAIGALCIWRWEIFFGKTAECSYTLAAGPQSLVMTSGEDGLRDRRLSWTCNTEDSCVALLHGANGVTDTIPTYGEKVVTMGGEQYMHVLQLDSLEAGKYALEIFQGEHYLSTVFSIIDQQEEASLVVFGDLLLHENAEEGMLRHIIEAMESQNNGNGVDAVVYTGNMLHESTQQCWQGWNNAMAGLESRLPQIAVPGSRDYDRGIDRVLDARWMKRFPMPHNGPERFVGKTYYIDYPLFRLIMLDTEALEVLVDYTVLQTWLSRVLQDAGDKWKIVVMHHSVHSASAGFDHPRLYTALHLTLDDADLIFSGNDLSYGRRADISLSDLFYEHHTVPVYVVLTSDSTEAAVPKCSPLDQRIGSNRAFFGMVHVTADTLQVDTRYLSYPDSIYDGFRIGKEDKVMLEHDSLPEEVIEMPAAHADGGLRARRFEHLRDARRE